MLCVKAFLEVVLARWLRSSGGTKGSQRNGIFQDIFRRLRTAHRWAMFRKPQPLQLVEKVRQYTSNLYGSTPPICTAVLSWLLSFKERETLQYASHLYCSTPPICTAVRPPLVRQYFWKKLGVGVTGTFLNRGRAPFLCKGSCQLVLTFFGGLGYGESFFKLWASRPKGRGAHGRSQASIWVSLELSSCVYRTGAFCPELVCFPSQGKRDLALKSSRQNALLKRSPRSMFLFRDRLPRNGDSDRRINWDCQCHYWHCQVVRNLDLGVWVPDSCAVTLAKNFPSWTHWGLTVSLRERNILNRCFRVLGVVVKASPQKHVCVLTFSGGEKTINTTGNLQNGLV